MAQLKDIEAQYPGLEHIMLQWPEGMPLREFKEQLRLVAGEVDAGIHRRYCHSCLQ